MTELVLVDRAVVQALNHAAQPQPLRRWSYWPPPPWPLARR
jgi:hypothetical protein